jgi:hypothetical protein
MILEGSCQCGKVTFTVESTTPYPFMICYCSICRKVAGGLGACNVMGKRNTLQIQGRKNLRYYHAVIREKGQAPVISGAERWFCARCGTHLYLLDDEWPDGVWPNAGVLDTPLPVPPNLVKIMLRYKPKWVPEPRRGKSFSRYPELSIAEWHERNIKKKRSD